MVRTQILIGTAAAVVAVAAAGTGVAVAGSSDDAGTTVSSRAAKQATAAALVATGGGRANAVERDSEDGATWEVEVTTPDGSTVDVRLDEGYRVVVIEGDHES
jgi:hypothetical protein